MNLTIFAGTFNPIHTAHLILAEVVRISINSEKILFIPSYFPPHKENSIAKAEHRMEMVRLATQNNPAFEVSDIEYKLDGKSYSLNTVKNLYKIYPGITGKINFMIGTDAFKHLDSWHKAEELAELVNFVVVLRNESSDVKEAAKNIKLQNLTYTAVNAPVLEISSSYIRNRIKNNESIKYLVPDSVENYILENKLYIN